MTTLKFFYNQTKHGLDSKPIEFCDDDDKDGFYRDCLDKGHGELVDNCQRYHRFIAVCEAGVRSGRVSSDYKIELIAEDR